MWVPDHPSAILLEFPDERGQIRNRERSATVNSGSNETANSEAALDRCRIVSFESRMESELRRMLERHGAVVVSAPALKEVPLADQASAFQFGERLTQGQVDVLVLLTGVGTRLLIDALGTRWGRDQVLAALHKCTLVCRGPKPVAALKRHGVKADFVAPEPNTWRDLVALFEQTKLGEGKRIYVQEYGRSNPELLSALGRHASIVSTVTLYGWTLPDDTGPLKNAISAMVSGNVQLACFTTGMQVEHLFEVAGRLELDGPLRQALSEQIVIASIGPMTTERLQQYGLSADIEPEHPKLGHMVLAVASQAHQALTAKLQRK